MNLKIAFLQILPGKHPDIYGILSDENAHGIIGGEFVHW